MFYNFEKLVTVCPTFVCITHCKIEKNKNDLVVLEDVTKLQNVVNITFWYICK